jgi:hypothetical protein
MREIIGRVAQPKILLNDPGVLIYGSTIDAPHVTMPSRDAMQMIGKDKLQRGARGIAQRATGYPFGARALHAGGRHQDHTYQDQTLDQPSRRPA